MRTNVICSGGLDSVSLAHVLAEAGELSRLV
ncbi:MAG: 7-cyano-7-deazaguanine synthase, partial [Pseudomonadota bacterium]